MDSESAETAAEDPSEARVEVSAEGIRALNSDGAVVMRFDFAPDTDHD